MQKRGVSVPKIPKLYSLKNERNPRSKQCLSTQSCSRPHPLCPALWPRQGLPVKDTVSSWEQDFMEDHFCHEAPDRPDVHYQNQVIKTSRRPTPLSSEPLPHHHKPRWLRGAFEKAPHLLKTLFEAACQQQWGRTEAGLRSWGQLSSACPGLRQQAEAVRCPCCRVGLGGRCPGIFSPFYRKREKPIERGLSEWAHRLQNS